MCGRFTLRTPLSKLMNQFAASAQFELPLRYNVAPTQMVAALRVESGTGERPSARHIVMLKWGLVPSWADDPSIGNRMINARGESVAEKPSFRAAFKKRRCLVLADGYYEWQKVGAKKQPYLIHLPEHRPFAMAGLWESWRPGENEPPLESCTIITTDASPKTRAIHDRMPVILEEEDYDRWLDPDLQDRQELEPLLVPMLSDDLLLDPVSTHVNNPRHDDPQCIEPAKTQRDLL